MDRNSFFCSICVYELSANYVELHVDKPNAKEKIREELTQLIISSATSLSIYTPSTMNKTA